MVAAGVGGHLHLLGDPVAEARCGGSLWLRASTLDECALVPSGKFRAAFACLAESVGSAGAVRAVVGDCLVSYPLAARGFAGAGFGEVAAEVVLAGCVAEGWRVSGREEFWDYPGLARASAGPRIRAALRELTPMYADQLAGGLRFALSEGADEAAELWSEAGVDPTEFGVVGGDLDRLNGALVAVAGDAAARWGVVSAVLDRRVDPGVRVERAWSIADQVRRGGVPAGGGEFTGRLFDVDNLRSL